MPPSLAPRPTDLDATEAREVIAAIAHGLIRVWDDVKRAYHGRAWLALGYASWDELCRNEFGASQIQLPREERREVVASLRESGMSTRAIAAVTSQSEGNVRNDLKHVASPAQNYAPDEARPPTTGLDGKHYPPPAPEPDIVDAEIVDEPATKPTRQRPITAVADSIATDTRRLADRLQRLADDPRVAVNKGRVDAALRPQLTKFLDIAGRLLDRLDTLKDR